MKRFFVIVLCILINIPLPGCSSTPKINRKLLPISTAGGLTYGLYGMDGEIETETHFCISPNSVFQKIFSFGNLIENGREYKLIIFSNYEQILFSVNNKPSNYFYDFISKPYEHTQFTITFPNLNAGYYDLLFIIVKDPNNLSLDENYRKQTDMSHLITMRYSLTVGEESEKMAEFKSPEFDYMDNDSLDGIFLSQQSHKLKRLLSLTGDPTDETELYIHIGNQSTIEKNYAVLLLYDWKQFPINTNEVLFLSIPQEQRVAIPFSLKFTENGVHNLTAICVEEPFQKTTIYTKRADFSIRVGVEVK